MLTKSDSARRTVCAAKSNSMTNGAVWLMQNFSIQDQVCEMIADYLEIPRDQLRPDRKLIDLFNDTDDLDFVLDLVTRKFKVKKPTMRGTALEHLQEILSRRRFHASDVLRLLTRKPEMDIGALTIGELCEIVENKEWPDRFVLQRK